MSGLHYPSLYQINTRVWLTELSRKLGRAATLDDVPDAELDRLAERGFDWVWFLSVWQTGPAGSGYRVPIPNGARNFRKLFRTCGKRISPVRVRDHRLRRPGRPGRRRGAGSPTATACKTRLEADARFCPEPYGADHPWVEDHPDYFVPGTEDLLAQEPQNYIRVKGKKGNLILAYGRDPYSPAGRISISAISVITISRRSITETLMNRIRA